MANKSRLIRVKASNHFVSAPFLREAFQLPGFAAY